MAQLRRFCKTPCFYYGAILIILMGLVYFGITRLPKVIVFLGINNPIAVATSSSGSLSQECDAKEGVLFSNQSQIASLEMPDLKVMENDCVAAFTTPRVFTTKVLGALFGNGEQARKDVREYTVEAGDSLKSIAEKFDISLNTLLWANDLSSASKVKAGQVLVILPVSGTLHFVKSGDTLGQIAKLYNANADDITDANDLANEFDVYIGDILIVPGGVMPKKAPVQTQTYLADNYFIFPVEGKITQRLHWYNGVDIASKCGTTVFAAAPGQVLKAKYGWNGGGGNVVTILHKDGVVSYYGHLMSILVKPGDMVDVGQKIGLMGGQPGMDGAGISTGCHLHFTVMGAKNPFSKYPLGYIMKYR